jgi:hypothetical protein
MEVLPRFYLGARDRPRMRFCPRPMSLQREPRRQPTAVGARKYVTTVTKSETRKSYRNNA